MGRGAEEAGGIGRSGVRRIGQDDRAVGRFGAECGGAEGAGWSGMARSTDDSEKWVE